MSQIFTWTFSSILGPRFLAFSPGTGYYSGSSQSKRLPRNKGSLVISILPLMALAFFFGSGYCCCCCCYSYYGLGRLPLLVMSFIGGLAAYSLCSSSSYYYYYLASICFYASYYYYVSTDSSPLFLRLYLYSFFLRFFFYLAVMPSMLISVHTLESSYYSAV